MKKLLLIMVLVATGALGMMAQKFALVDMEYIMKNIPAYEMANEQLNQLSQRYQREIENLNNEASDLYQRYLQDKVFLTADQVKAREQEVVDKEKQATELRYKYFGPEGELNTKRQSLLKPIQDDVYNAIKKLSEERGYQLIMDRASSTSIVFASPKIDVSNEVLAKLGYSN